MALTDACCLGDSNLRGLRRGPGRLRWRCASTTLGLIEHPDGAGVESNEFRAGGVHFARRPAEVACTSQLESSREARIQIPKEEEASDLARFVGTQPMNVRTKRQPACMPHCLSPPMPLSWYTDASLADADVEHSSGM